MKNKKVSYSLNWMGPISNKWYEDHKIPVKYTIDTTNKKTGEPVKYKIYEENYSAGRIVIQDGSQYPKEICVPPMRSSCWLKLGEWLIYYQTDEPKGLGTILKHFEENTGCQIVWYNNNKEDTNDF